MRYFRLLVVSALLLLAVDASAQTTSGSMSGTVVDAQDQVVPGADVILTNEQTQEVRRTVTNEVGLFTFPALVPGPYTVRVELSGFRPIERRSNMVLANNRLALPPLRLEVGSLAEAVTVSAIGEVVATSQTSHQALLDLKQVENLSIRGRDPVSFLKILPGVALLANDQETFGGSFSTPVPNIQGGGGQTIMVDGVNGGDGGGGGALSNATNVDAIAEINVQMSAYTAEYGLKGGAQVNIITKHGGAEYHGTGYWYKRHEMWNAINFFNNLSGLPKPNYRYSTLGGTLGGPIPKMRKLFFFYSVDDTQVQDLNIVRRYTMPTALERQGDFSQTRRPNGTLIQVFDPLTGQPFPGNVIPQNRIDPRGQALMNLLPAPNVAGDPTHNFVYQEPSIDHPRRQQMIRVDYRPTERDSFSTKYSHWFTKSVGYNVAGASSRWGLVSQRYDFFVNAVKMDYTRVLNTSTVLEFAGGFSDQVEDGPPGSDEALRGIQRSTYPQIARLGQFASRHNPMGLIPVVRFGALPSGSGTSDCGGAQVTPCSDIFYDGRWPITGDDVNFNLAMNLTHTRGAHTYKMGIMREDELFGQARSGVFGGEFNFAHDANDPLSTQYAYANAVLGHVFRYTESMGRVPDDRRQRAWAWFAQDTWKVNPRLTLDIGLRMYKWANPVTMAGEASAFTFERFDPRWGGNPPVLFRPIMTAQGRRAQNPLTGQILPQTYVGQIVPGTGYSCGVITPESPCEINGFVTQRDGNYLDSGDEGFIEAPSVQFDPRFGLAYAPNPKTVIRVAGGSFHDSFAGNSYQQGGGNAAFRYNREILFTDLDSYLTGTSATALVPNTSGPVRTDNRRTNNYRYTAAIQREVGRNIVVDAAYVGSRTKYVTREKNVNYLPAGARFLPENRDPTVAASPQNPGALPDAFLRPILGFNDIEIATPIGFQSYDSLQMQVTRRFTGRFEMAGSYTWARGYEDTYGNNDVYVTLPNIDQRRDIQEHVLVASYQYALPAASSVFGDNKGVRWVLDNWRISGISTFGTGGRGNIGTSTGTLTGNVTYSPAFDFTGGGEQCALYDISGELELPRGDRSLDRWFNTDAVKPLTARGQIGNDCRQWKFTQPGWHNHDLSFFKDIRLKGDQQLQYRLEIYNVFNQVSFQDVDNTPVFNPTTGAQTDTNFGKITSARNERRMQMSIRYIF
jgi:Carboxypeptidase regulatory-like domain